MAGVDLKAIHEALAAQLRNNLSETDWNTSAVPFSGKEWPLIEVWPRGDGYVGYWESFGASGKADIQIDLRVFADGNTPEDLAARMFGALSVGTGHGDSIVDAVMADRTIGNTVGDAIARRGDWSPAGDDLGSVAVIPVDIILAKQGAKV